MLWSVYCFEPNVRRDTFLRIISCVIKYLLEKESIRWVYHFMFVAYVMTARIGKLKKFVHMTTHVDQMFNYAFETICCTWTWQRNTYIRYRWRKPGATRGPCPVNYSILYPVNTFPTAWGGSKELLLLIMSIELHKGQPNCTPNEVHDLLQLANNCNEEKNKQPANFRNPDFF